jgi:pimeloyl-ACP methyl ester carboxylesterase
VPLDTSLIFRADPRVPLMFTGSLTSTETDSLASLLTCKNHQEEIGRWIAKADPDFREMFPASLTNHLVSDEYKLLRDSGLPTALVHGEKDALINISYLNSIHLTNLWQKQPVSIKDACHVPQMEKPEEFNSLLLHFVKSLL